LFLQSFQPVAALVPAAGTRATISSHTTWATPSSGCRWGSPGGRWARRPRHGAAASSARPAELPV